LRLRLGDDVRFVSPASTPDRDSLEHGTSIVESWKLEVEIPLCSTHMATIWPAGMRTGWPI
jgi:hypothetical protein